MRRLICSCFESFFFRLRLSPMNNANVAGALPPSPDRHYTSDETPSTPGTPTADSRPGSPRAPRDASLLPRVGFAPPANLDRIDTDCLANVICAAGTQSDDVISLVTRTISAPLSRRWARYFTLELAHRLRITGLTRIAGNRDCRKNNRRQKFCGHHYLEMPSKKM